jgi:hypothetical protein
MTIPHSILERMVAMGFLKFAVFGVGVLLLTLLIAAFLGQRQWRAEDQELISKMEVGQPRGNQMLVRDEEIKTLPPVVQSYFRAVLPERFALIRSAKIRHRGTFNMGETADQWISFTSEQHVVTSPPGFIWSAKMAMFSGVPIHVRDAYVRREGILKPSLLGIYALADFKGGGALAEGELMRFLAEAAWYPTALLPSQGVVWQAVDDRSARATLQDGPNAVSLTFSFAPDGLTESVRAEARGRIVDGKTIPTPWEGRWSNYAQQNGMLVPMIGEVAWLLPEGRKPYWRGKIDGIIFSYD